MHSIKISLVEPYYLPGNRGVGEAIGLSGSPAVLPEAPHAGFPAQCFVIQIRIWKAFSSRREAGRDAQPGDDLACPKNRRGARMPQPLVAPGFFHAQQKQMGNLQLSAPFDIPPKWHCSLLKI
jgi:hypothetical protein